MNRLIRSTLSVVFVLVTSCSTLSGLSSDPLTPIPPEVKPTKPMLPCYAENSPAQVYRVSQDGRDIGREVRSTQIVSGPLGEERVTLSHFVRRFKTDTVELDRLTIISERVLVASNSLLQSAFVTIDESTTWLSLVGYNGEGWERIHEELESVRDPIRSTPEGIDLTGNPIIGFGLNELLRQVAIETIAPRSEVPFYVARMQTPLSIDIRPRETLTSTTDENTGNACRVTATRSGSDRIWLSIVVDSAGRIVEEIYPSLHQIRTLDNRSPTPPSVTGNPFVGLYSQTYLALPETSTDNRYEIISEQPIQFEDLAFLEQSSNQTLARVNDRTLTLSVKAGAPDGTAPPTERDLEPNSYIDSDSPLIVNALAWLKSKGKSGHLPPHRKENAAALIAGLSQQNGAKSRWKSADETARVLMNYVHAILPDKQHTHTMKSASLSLSEGMGDCTEHSVLFAALMRAAGFPSRLVSGIYLARGGAWVYHMWNEYWDGSRWQSIDTAVGPFYRTGAHYIALGSGVSDFADHRNKIAFFLDTAFSGLAINLVSATAEGQILHLATPSRQHFSFSDATIFNATTFMRRGDMAGALALVEKDYRKSDSPLRMQLLMAELLSENSRIPEALQQINEIRKRTSLPSNVVFLDILELKSLIRSEQLDKAREKLNQLCEGDPGENETCRVFHSRLLEAEKKFSEAMALLDAGLATTPDSSALRVAKMTLAANPDASFSEAQLIAAVRMGNAVLNDTYYADAESMKAMTQLLFRRSDWRAAQLFLFHSLLLLPDDRQLNELKNAATEGCRTDSATVATPAP